MSTAQTQGERKQKVTLAKLTPVEGWENKVGAKNSQNDEHIKHHSIDVDISPGGVQREGSRSAALIGKVDFRLWAVAVKGSEGCGGGRRRKQGPRQVNDRFNGPGVLG